jgi:hypothetical protein
VVVTRHNNRALLDEHGEPARNRETWRVDHAHLDGILTVTRTAGHGTATLPGDYVAEHVRLGYAATAHGHQGDTLDVAYTLVSASTGHRGLYVGATRGRDANHLHVVTDVPDAGEARDVLDCVISRDRADIPAVARRRQLTEDLRGAQPAASGRVANAERLLTEATRPTAPHQRAIRQADQQVAAAEATLGELQEKMAGARPWARPQFTTALADATDALEQARSHRSQFVDAATPALDRLCDAESASNEKPASNAPANDSMLSNADPSSERPSVAEP